MNRQHPWRPLSSTLATPLTLFITVAAARRTPDTISPSPLLLPQTSSSSVLSQCTQHHQMAPAARRFASFLSSGAWRDCGTQHSPIAAKPPRHTVSHPMHSGARLCATLRPSSVFPHAGQYLSAHCCAVGRTAVSPQRSSETVSFFRPFARRRFSTSCPSLDAIRVRNPCLLTRLRFDG